MHVKLKANLSINFSPTSKLSLRFWSIDKGMDPLSITAGAFSVLGAIAKASVEISHFISGLRQAADDMASVQRELEAISIPVTQLTELASVVPDDLRDGLVKVLSGCKEEVEGIQKGLSNAIESRNRRVRWVMSGRADMNKRRSVLEKHKSALILTLTISGLYVFFLGLNCEKLHAA
jgi:hypothetical protein